MTITGPHTVLLIGMLAQVLQQLLLFSGCRLAEGLAVVDQEVLSARNIDDHIWQLVMVEIDKTQGDNGLIGVWSWHADGGNHAHTAGIAAGEVADAYHAVQVDGYKMAGVLRAILLVYKGIELIDTRIAIVQGIQRTDTPGQDLIRRRPQQSGDHQANSDEEKGMKTPLIGRWYGRALLCFASRCTLLCLTGRASARWRNELRGAFLPSLCRTGMAWSSSGKQKSTQQHKKIRSNQEVSQIACIER